MVVDFWMLIFVSKKYLTLIHYCKENNEKQNNEKKNENCKVLEPGNVKVTRDIKGNEAEILLYIINNESFLHDINRAKGNKFLQVISECLTTQIDSLNSIIESKVLKNRGSMCERETTINNEATLGLRKKPIGPVTSLVKVNE